VQRELFLSADVEETEQIGAAFARAVLERFGENPSFSALEGDLGAGKTAFTRGFVSVLSPESRVKSPTYTIVNEYRRGTYPVFHFDFYRLEDPETLDSIGFDEYLQQGICIGEWSENLGEYRPADAVTVRITKTGETTREIEILWPGTKEGEGNTSC